MRHGEAPALAEVRSRLEGEPGLLRRGPEAILYAIMDRVVDGTRRWWMAWKTT